MNDHPKIEVGKFRLIQNKKGIFIEAIKDDEKLEIFEGEGMEIGFKILENKLEELWKEHF